MRGIQNECFKHKYPEQENKKASINISGNTRGFTSVGKV